MPELSKTHTSADVIEGMREALAFVDAVIWLRDPQILSMGEEHGLLARDALDVYRPTTMLKALRALPNSKPDGGA